MDGLVIKCYHELPEADFADLALFLLAEVRLAPKTGRIELAVNEMRRCEW